MKSVTDKLVLNITAFEQEKSIKRTSERKQRRLAALF
ncbi:histidine kinase [Vibrio cholerae]|nr:MULTISPECIES: histidine kinase [Vibrio]EGR2448674.1 histidine kinase [Vibrio cholerae]EGR4282908.1 histidine kinase [Vibrio cholerae]EGR4294063.1 histidine kinase [Vibrio cholerae]EGR4297128.1 histidine kinase [Vibrio cholerae]EKE8760649.1 histidine kinase [Vibrio cholerae]